MQADADQLHEDRRNRVSARMAQDAEEEKKMEYKDSFTSGLYRGKLDKMVQT